MGDPAGIGPEIIVASWLNEQLHRDCRRVVLGHPSFLQQAIQTLNVPLEVVTIESITDIPQEPDKIGCLECSSVSWNDVTPATVDAKAGQLAAEALYAAIDLALDNSVDAIVTAPFNKQSISLAGVPFPGHTEMLGDRCNVPHVAMMLYLDQNDRVAGDLGLGVIHTTLHQSVKSAVADLSTDRIIHTSILAGQFAERMARARNVGRAANVGVAALNPHGGENGLFGDEEITTIQPAIDYIQSQRFNWNCTGPLPCDSLMVRAANGEFDAVVAMYHDQGHIALKLLGMKYAVNVTLGLPIIRTSVAHGTAFDIAWQGKADPTSLIRAMNVALDLSRQAENQ